MRLLRKAAPVPGWRSPGKPALPLLALLSLLMVSCNKTNNPAPESRKMQVWLHRVNTTAKARLFENAYTGFELDVHYDTVVHTFIVKHDASDTSTLTLSAWLSAITDPGRLGYWLDFKNLSSWNRDLALPELLRIRDRFSLNRKTIVVESSDPVSLVRFDTLNFRTSFYIPWFDPAALSEEERLAYRDYIRDLADASGIGTLSGYSIQHDFMTQYFPKMNKLLWYLDSFDPAVKDSVIAATAKDPTVEVLLVAENVLKDSQEK